jgi:predicted dehydrogenase
MRVALIEVGHWHAAMHLRSLQLAGARVVGVSDRQAGVAERFAAGLDCPAFQDYQVMLRETRPEFVLAMGRHVDMPAIAHDLLQAKIPFAIEKPIGLSADQVAPLVELAQQRHAFVAVPFVNRYSELWTRLEQLEPAGRAGLRAHAHFRVVNGPPQRYELDRVDWMLDPKLSGGGSIRNLGIHTADAFLKFVNGEEVEVLGAAISYRLYGKAVEEIGTALLRSQSGIIGTVEAGYTFASMTAGDFEWRVATANATLIDRNRTLQVATLDDGQVQQWDIADQGRRYDQFGLDTLGRLQAGQPPIADIEDCYRAMRLIDEIYKKAVRTPYAGPKNERDNFLEERPRSM